MIISTCPECGKDLQQVCLAVSPPIIQTWCECGWRHNERETVHREVFRAPEKGNGCQTANNSTIMPCPNCGSSTCEIFNYVMIRYCPKCNSGVSVTAQ
jgi:hypothetical protein